MSSGGSAVNNSREPTLGLIGGLGVAAAIFYYRSLVNEHLIRGISANILMVHADVRRTMSLAAARKPQELATYLSGLLGQLAAGGATVATIPAFSPQVCANELAMMTPLPLISLLDAIAAEVERRALRRVTIFGARVTMETELFGALKDRVEVISPSNAELDLIGEIYRTIVEAGKATPEEYETIRSLAHKHIEAKRLDAILLAGTDWSFVFDPAKADFPNLDGARTHIDAIMRKLQIDPLSAGA